MSPELVITPLPHGLLRRNDSVGTCAGLYHLVVTFSNPATEQNQTIIELLQETEILVNRFPGVQYASTLIKHLKQRLATVFAPETLLPTGPVDQSRKGANRRQPLASSVNQQTPVSVLTRRKRSANQQTPVSALTRRKRGLFNFIGTIGKELFGLSTESDLLHLKETIDKNSKTNSVLTHHVNKISSVLNVTQKYVIENRKITNQLISTCSHLNDWVRKILLSRQFHDLLLIKINVIQNLVRDLENVQTKMLRMRKDLEKGYLSEDLLPVEEMRSLINSVSIPEGSEFITPIEWYYSKLPVRIISLNGEIVYSFDLPLINKKRLTAKQFISYPTPNVRQNVTLKIKVPDSKWYTRQAGEAIELPPQCFGKHPTVCPPTAISRAPHADPSCASALLDPNHRQVEQTCFTEVKAGQRDKLIYHDVNTFILITWGTNIIEGCLRDKIMTLKPGTYRINWSGSCPLCTRHHCVPGVKLSHSTLKLKNTWQPIKIPNIKNFSELAVNVKLPKVLTVPKMVKLNQITSPSEPSIVWSQQDTNTTIDVFVILIIICISVCVIYLSCVHVRKCRKEGRNEARTEVPELLVPPTDSNNPGVVQTPAMSAEQAAAILIANTQKS